MILCCGEALIDMIPSPTQDGQVGFVPHTGGAVFNTAIALGRLGCPVGMLTGLSTDMFGQQLSDALKASHVDTSQIILSDRPSTLAFVQLVEGQASYAFFDENSAGRMLTPQDLPTLPKDVSALFFGGISLACAPGADAYASLLDQHGAGRVVMLDPNIRPGFTQDIDAYRARLDRMIGRSDIVKVSDEDLNWLVPEPQSLRDKALALLGKGPSVVVLTRGKQGATGFLSDGSEITVQAEAVDIVDTVGAGDTFNAGFLAQLSKTGHLTADRLKTLDADTLRDALAFSARVAAITVSRAGANPPWAKDIT